MDLRPAIPVVVDVDTNRYYVDSRNGERIMAYEHVYTEYDVGRIRAGYCCINCGEAQHEKGLPKAFPDACYVCKFPMREKQLERFGEEFEGFAAPIGPTRSIEELRAADEEAKEKARRKREGRPSSHIWVPA